MKSNIKISAHGLNKEKFIQLTKLVESEFSQYQVEYKEPFHIWEYIPNVNYNPGTSHPDDEEIAIFKEAICGCNLHLKKCTHINFDIKFFLYEDQIHIKGVYYYANFNADKLKKLIEAYLLQSNFTTGDQLLYDKQTYKQWVDGHPDQKWAQHNYKIDKEDLAKLGIEV